jgi:hypothetical protein
MRRLIALLTVAVLMLGATSLSAHDNFRVIGTITKLQTTQLDVKTKEAGTVSIAIDKQTIVWRDKKKVPAGELKAGLSVVVDAYGDSEEDLLALDVTIVPPIAPRPAKK